jgi:acyl dehydratase
MSQTKFDKMVDEWIERVNKHRGTEKELFKKLGPYPVDADNFHGQQRSEWVTTDTVRHYAASLGDRNPLWWREDYAKKTRWGGIIAPPTFTDSIAMLYTQYPFLREPLGGEYRYDVVPGGHRRELFQVIRPGDRLKVVSKWLGLEEKKSKEPRPYRLFIDSNRYTYINQRDENVAVVDGTFPVLIASSDSRQEEDLFEPRKRRKFTDEERDAIDRGYAEETRRGADTLHWEDVVLGQELKTLVVGPLTTWDQVAFFCCALTGHAPPFDIQWERRKLKMERLWLDPELNVYRSIGEGHFIDGVGIGSERTGGYAVGIGILLEGLISRNICNWMGDDGFLKMLDCRFRAVPIVGDVLRVKGRVTNKSSEGGEYLVDLEVRCENQDGLLLVPGKATVRLLSRTQS